MDAFGLNFCHGLGLGLHERPLVSRLNSLEEPIELKAGMVFAVETYCPASDGILGRAHRGGGDPHADGPEDHLAVSGARAADRQPVLTLATRPSETELYEARLDRHRPHGLRDGRAPREEPAPTSPSGTARARKRSRSRSAWREGRGTPAELAACDIVFVHGVDLGRRAGSRRGPGGPAVRAGKAPKLVVECSSISLEGSAELRALLREARHRAAGGAGVGQREGHQGRAAVVRVLGAAGRVRRRVAVSRR